MLFQLIGFFLHCFLIKQTNMIKIDFRTMGNTHQILLLKTRMSIYTIFSNRIEQNIHTRTRTII